MQYKDTYEQKPDHHFRTEAPNIIFELDLTPYEITVYLMIKRIAGDHGKCWQSIKNLSLACKIGETKLKECLKSLEIDRTKLGGLPLISLEKRFLPNGSRDTNLIVITPIWRLNGDFFRSETFKDTIKDELSKKSYSEFLSDPPPLSRKKTNPESRDEYKQDLSEEDPKDKHTGPVCLSSFEEVKEILKNYRFDKKSIEAFRKYSVDHLKDALISAEAFMKKGKVDNPEGCVRNAIQSSYKPKKEKEDSESKKNKILDTIEENKASATILIKEYNLNARKDLKFTIKDNCIEVKLKNGYDIIDLSNEKCMKKLKKYLNQ